MKLNPFLFAIWGIYGLLGCSSWYETLESTLSTFFPLLSVSLIKVLLKAVGDKETFHFRNGGGISRVVWFFFFCMWAWQMENASKGSLHKWQPSIPCVNALGKHRTKKYVGLLLENCLILHISKHVSPYFDNVSWQAQVSKSQQHSVHMSPTASWLQTTTDWQNWFPNSTPTPGDTGKYIDIFIIFNRFGFLFLIPWNMV